MEFILFEIMQKNLIPEKPKTKSINITYINEIKTTHLIDSI